MNELAESTCTLAVLLQWSKTLDGSTNSKDTFTEVRLWPPEVVPGAGSWKAKSPCGTAICLAPDNL
jgi:hypothetical protein